MYRQFVLGLFAMILLSVPVRADNVITAGFATLTPFNPITQMQFSGSGFSVSARGDGFGGGGFVPCMGGCTAGANLTLSANTGFWAFSDVSGSMFVNGTLYTFVFQAAPTLPQVVGSGSMAFSGGGVVVPLSDDPFVTLSAPFTVTGSLTGSAVNGQISLGFAGSGIGTLTLRNLGNGQYIATGVTYSFQPVAEEVPEPTTLLLFTTGLVGVAVRYRNRRHR